MTTVADDAASLSTSLGITVYHGFVPDAEDGSLDEILVLDDFAFTRPEHGFGEDAPLITHYGIAIRARSSTQTAARALCDQGYQALLAMGYLAVSPVISLGRDDGGRFEAVAEVEAHSIS